MPPFPNPYFLGDLSQVGFIEGYTYEGIHTYDSNIVSNSGDAFSDFASSPPQTPVASWFLNPMDVSTPADYFSSYGLFDSQGIEKEDSQSQTLTFDDLTVSSDFNPFFLSSHDLALQNSQENSTHLDAEFEFMSAESHDVILEPKQPQTKEAPLPSVHPPDNEMMFGDQTIKWTIDEDKMILLYKAKYDATLDTWTELSKMEIFAGKSSEAIGRRHEHLLYLFSQKKADK